MSTLTNSPLPIPERMLRSLKAAYATPPRAYHSYKHIEDVLTHYHSVTWAHPREVYLSVLFHDAIYVVGRADNEARSADLALEACATHFPNETLDLPRIRHLIELTARHGKLDRAQLDEDARRFLDCDMAILGAEPALFDAYDAAIADEYAVVPRPVFRFNRKRFLQGVLNAERIYLSDHFHALLDARARDNLRRAIGPTS